MDRVAAFAVATGRELAWDGEHLARLELGALPHDVGKLGVEDRILRKPGKLDAEEWVQMRQHPRMGARLLEGAPFIEGGMLCAVRHHEQYDGRGYPDGLAGEAIPIKARVIAVADTFDVMTSDRPYRNGLPLSTALEEIRRCAGTQFDPTIADAFLRVEHSSAMEALTRVDREEKAAPA